MYTEDAQHCVGFAVCCRTDRLGAIGPILQHDTGEEAGREWLTRYFPPEGEIGDTHFPTSPNGHEINSLPRPCEWMSFFFPGGKQPIACRSILICCVAQVRRHRQRRQDACLNGVRRWQLSLFGGGPKYSNSESTVVVESRFADRSAAQRETTAYNHKDVRVFGTELCVQRGDSSPGTTPVCAQR